MTDWGRSLELFLIDGTPDGMQTARIFNWTGHVLMTPRTQLAKALKSRESGYTGVYILLDEDEKNGKIRAYIGESENIGDRIRNHDSKLDWWTKAILITSAANDLNKAHVKYLESRLVEEARRAKTLNLENGNTPPRPSLTDASTANMEQFLEYILLVLPAIRVDGFLQKTRSTSRDTGSLTAMSRDVGPVFELRTPKKGVFGTAKLENGEFVVQPGSVGRSAWGGPGDHGYKKLFDKVVASGAYIQEGANRVFMQAYVLTSPSAAGAVLKGRSTNGQEAWRLASDNKKTYRDWEDEQLNSTEVISDDTSIAF